MTLVVKIQKIGATGRLGWISVAGLLAVSLGLHFYALVPSVRAIESRFGEGFRDAPSTSPTTPTEKPTFTLLAIIDGFDPIDNSLALDPKHKDDPYIHVWFHGASFRASDGKRLTAVTTNLESMSFAAEYLNRKLKSAKIIDRKPRTNEKGEVIGERIVALFSVSTDPEKNGPNDPHKSIATVIRTAGTVYNRISAVSLDEVPASLDDVLALEEYLDKPHTSYPVAAPPHTP